MPTMTRPIVPVRHELKTLDEIKDAMVSACKILDAFGLTKGVGHISSRLPNSTNFLVTPYKAIGLTKKEELLIVDSEGKELESHSIPYGGIVMHLGIYHKRPDVGAICRFYGSEMVEVFGVLRRSVKPLIGHFYVLGPEVRVLDADDLDMTSAATDRTGDLLTDAYGIIFHGDGAATFGTNMIDACVRAVFLDEAARIQYKASLLGAPLDIDMTLQDRINESYWDKPDYYVHLGKPGYDVYWRFWEFYKSRIR